MNSSLHYWLLRWKYTFLIEPSYIWKDYRPFSFCEKKSSPKYVFMVDGKMNHGGMFDRLKGLISIYALSKINHADFRIHFNYPFKLENYLISNVYNWEIAEEDIIYSFPQSRPLIVYGENVYPTRVFKQRRGEIHYYYGFDSLDKLNRIYKTRFEFGQLYQELFKPTEYLQRFIDLFRKNLSENYIAIHIRFCNLLGDVVEREGTNHVLDLEKASLLKTRCKDKIIEILQREAISLTPSDEQKYSILLSTDSQLFTEFIQKEIPQVYVVPGEIRHVDTVEETTDAQNIKLFLDYYMLSGAKRVYSLTDKNEILYKSAFPQYSAKIGGTLFKRECVEWYDHLELTDI